MCMLNYITQTSEHGYRFWDSENQKILRHKDVVFNERIVSKDLLTESTLKQCRSAVDSKFVELDDAHVDKIQSILEGNENPKQRLRSPN